MGLYGSDIDGMDLGISMPEYMDTTAEEKTLESDLAKMNDQQRTAFNMILDSVSDRRPVSKLFDIEGPGGTG